jgi:hypothetical protein
MEEHISGLVSQALTEIDNSTVTLSASIRKCLRIARLRNDFINFIWLAWETINFSDQKQQMSVLEDVITHLTSGQYGNLRKKFGEAWILERKYVSVSVNDDMEIVYDNGVLTKSIGEIELDVERLRQQAQDTTTPQGLHSLDLYVVNQSNTQTRTISRILEASYRSILERVRNRVYEFLSQTEQQLIYGKIHADIFEQNRMYVELKLGELCPNALAPFTAAYHQVASHNTESMAQALLSTRRLLKALADVLYPPKDQLVVGADGKEHKVDDKHYIARLWQYIFEKTPASHASHLLQGQVNDLGSRLDKLHDLMNKGLHAQIGPFDFNQCLIQTYLTVGDLLRISENVSAISGEANSDDSQTTNNAT